MPDDQPTVARTAYVTPPHVLDYIAAHTPIGPVCGAGNFLARITAAPEYVPCADAAEPEHDGITNADARSPR